MTLKRISVILCISALLLTFSASAFAAGGQGQGRGKGAQVTDATRGPIGMALNLSLGRADGTVSSTVADYLGISQEELIADRQSGKSLVQIAAGCGITEQELIDLIMEERSAQIDRLVSEGKLTTERAELHKATMAEHVKANINRTTVGPAGMGMNNGFGGNKGFGRGTGVCPYLNTASQ